MTNLLSLHIFRVIKMRIIQNLVVKYVLSTTALYDKILDYCKAQKMFYLYIFFMAIFSIYLAKINSTTSAILGTPVLNRSNFKEKNTSGMFVSTVPFKIDLDFNINFKDFLGQGFANASLYL